MSLKISALTLSVVIIVSLFCASRDSYAETNLNIGAAAECDFSNYERSPAPALANTGSNVSQQYILYLDGGLLRSGMLDSSFGVSLGDRYRRHATDFEDRVRFDYGGWLKAEAESQHDTDEEIFFSSTSQPQSPIYSVKERYNTRLRMNQASDIEYNFESIERKDLTLGNLTNEMTQFHTVKFDTQAELFSINSEYRQSDFTDRLGVRSDVDSRGLNLDMYYKPSDFFNASGFFESLEDADINNNTKLRTKDSGIEFDLMPTSELKLRDKIKFKKDVNTQTQEDIVYKSNEIVLNVEPLNQVNLEFAYKKQDEDKERQSSSITSTIDEERFSFGLAPFRRVGVQGGASVSDKSSTSSSENLKNTRMYTDISCDVTSSVRLSADVSRSEQENTFTSLIESDTKSVSAGLQYTPNKVFYLFMHLDTTRTDNPSTGAFTANDAMSLSLNIDPFDFFTAVLRTSVQKTTGSSESSFSERMLNSAGFNINLLKNFKISPEFEFINSKGASASDEALFDTAILYAIGKFDISLRFQDKQVLGALPSDRTSLSSNIKYKISQDVALGTRFSSIDYTDTTIAENNYNSTMTEGLLSMRF